MSETKGRGRPRKRVEIGNNGPDEDLIRIAVKQMIEMNEQVDAVRAKRSKLRKTLKLQGLELGHLDNTIRMLEWDSSEVKAHFQLAAGYAQALNLPAGELLDLFDPADDEGEHLYAARRWREVGKKDGLAGRGWPDQPPEGCAAEHWTDYSAGHEDGSEQVRKAWLKHQQNIAPPTAATIKLDESEEPDEPTEAETAFADAE